MSFDAFGERLTGKFAIPDGQAQLYERGATMRKGESYATKADVGTTTGMGLVDEGGDHVHVIRNEGAVEARTITVQLLPDGATRRIDAPENPACTF